MMSQQAQLLQCPDCGHRHDLAALGDVHTFRCEDCGRALKVPAQFRNGADAAPPQQPQARPVATDTDPTVVQPAVSRIPEPAPTPRPVDDVAPAPAEKRPPRQQRVGKGGKVRVPIYWRLLIWIAAIPIGFVIVFEFIARKLGWLTQNDLIDAFTSGGWDRFRPIAQLLPLAAFVIAVIVQLSVFGLECLYRRRARMRADAAPQGAAASGGLGATGS